jgi:hypothetical protein
VEDIVDELSDPVSRTLTAIDQMMEAEPRSHEVISDDSPNIPTSSTATSGAFLVTNWLVAEGEG